MISNFRKLSGLGLTLLILFGLTSLVFAQESTNVTLAELNTSGQSGTAVLTAMGDQTEVVVNITPGEAGLSQPIHIHSGTCANLGGVEYPLTDVVDGQSTTTVDASLSSLMTGEFAINAHKSADEASVYVACGDISALTLPETGGVSLPWPSILLIIGGLAVMLGGLGLTLVHRSR